MKYNLNNIPRNTDIKFKRNIFTFQTLIETRSLRFIRSFNIFQSLDRRKLSQGNRFTNSYHRSHLMGQHANFSNHQQSLIFHEQQVSNEIKKVL